MAGQPVKPGNWGDWAVIEHKPCQKPRTCGDCIHFDYTDNTCTVRPAHVYDVSRFYWRRCPNYESGDVSAPPRKTSKKQTIIKSNVSKPVFNEKINIGDYVIDFNRSIGRVVGIDRMNHTVDVQFPLRLAKFSYPYVFVSGKLHLYTPHAMEPSSKESVLNHTSPALSPKRPQTQVSQQVKAESIINASSSSAKTATCASSSSPAVIHKDSQNKIDNSRVSMLRRVALEKQKRPQNLNIWDFCIGMELIHRSKMLGTGCIAAVCTQNATICVIFPAGKRRIYRVPQDFIAGIVRVK